MFKPEVKFEGGKLTVKAATAIDTDADQKAAATIAVEIMLDPAEVLSEIVKKDVPLVEGILKQVKA